MISKFKRFKYLTISINRIKLLVRRVFFVMCSEKCSYLTDTTVLTLQTLITTTRDDTLNLFVLFSEKIRLDISCESSALHEISRPFCLPKNNTINSKKAVCYKFESRFKGWNKAGLIKPTTKMSYFRTMFYVDSLSLFSTMDQIAPDHVITIVIVLEAEINEN